MGHPRWARCKTLQEDVVMLRNGSGYRQLAEVLNALGGSDNEILVKTTSADLCV